MSALAERYAAALADVAVARKAVAEIGAGLTSFAEMFRDSAELRNCLETPAVSAQKKQAVVAELVRQAAIHAEVKNFLFVLVDHGRMNLLGEIQEAFRAEVNSRMGIVEAEVVSARELSREEKSQLKKALEQVTGKKVEAHYRMDAGLIGGTKVRMGSTIYDGSVREQLNRLRARLESQ